MEQLSGMARESGRRVVDIGSDKPVETVARQLAGVSERTRAPDPSLNVSVLGAGVGVGGVSRSWTTRYGREDLGALVLDVCSCEKHGLMLTIDEIQKVDLDDVSAICDAFQMASRKRYDVMHAERDVKKRLSPETCGRGGGARPQVGKGAVHACAASRARATKAQLAAVRLHALLQP